MRCEFCQGAGHVGYERDWLWTREGIWNVPAPNAMVSASSLAAKAASGMGS
jgi:hypothetical protein